MMKKNRRPNIRLMSACAVVAAVALAASPAQADVKAIPDREISDTAEREILMDDAVSLNDITVTTNDGIVTLTGEVDNLLAKERAARICETVRGVRSVVNQVDIASVPGLTNDMLRGDITQRLLRDPATDSYEVHAEVRDGVVSLTGTVDSWQERELTANVVKGVRGVREINNRIEVDYAQSRPDTEIQHEIEAAMEWDALLDETMIVADVTDGNVELSGTVGSAAERRRALANAWVAGVENVDADGIQVAHFVEDHDTRDTMYVEKGNDEIRRAINDALLYDPRAQSFDITPHVDNGVVTLRGTVDNVKAKRAAAQVARDTVGVNSVRNRIKVDSDSLVNDSEIEDRLDTNLLVNPYVNRFDVNPQVVNGTAYLYGSVDTLFEKAEVDDVAATTKGVDRVVNNLNVEGDLGHLPYTPFVDQWATYDFNWYGEKAGGVSASDREIREEIHDQLWWSPFVDADQVNITVDEGVAKLSGTVDSWREFWAASENAYEGGAAFVDNDLNVQ